MFPVRGDEPFGEVHDDGALAGLLGVRTHATFRPVWVPAVVVNGALCFACP
jgi:hypothetical protein